MSWNNRTNGFAWCRRPAITAAVVAITLLFAAAARAQDGVVQNDNYPTSVGPWEVLLYEQPNFIGMWTRYTLQPGMRQRLVPEIDLALEDKISSIQVGEKVGVVIYEHRRFFASDTHGYQLLSSSVPALGSDYYPLNDKLSSLIVYPKAAKGPFGVELSDYSEWWYYSNLTFFPLPELEASSEESWPFLGEFNLDKNANSAYIRSERLRHNIELVLYSERNFGGRAITLPGASGVWPSNLGEVDYSDTAASLRVRWKGEPTNLGPPAPPQFTVRAGINLSGRDYRSFETDAGADDCWQTCGREPQCKAYTFVRPGIQRARGVCWLKSSIPAPQNDVDCVSGWIGEAPPPVTTAGPDAVKDFRVVRREGQRVLFQIDYRIGPEHGPVVAVGTWLYEAGQSIAGYEPMSITALGDGSVTQWVVLVPGARASDEVEFIFFVPGQEPFLKTRLPLRQAWTP